MWRITANLIIRILSSVLLILSGVILSLLDITGPAAKLVSDLGLALIITGMVSTFYETVIRWLEGNEAGELTANAVYKRIREAPLSATGIKLVSPVRKGFAGYYQWAVDVAPIEMFFAGRSAVKPSWWTHLPNETRDKINEAVQYNADVMDKRLPTFDRMPDIGTDDWEILHQFWI